MKRQTRTKGAFLAAALLILAFRVAPTTAQEEEADPAEVTIGERLFIETRFSEFFKASNNPVNTPLATGDPALDTTETTGSPLPGPFAGESMNCRACHLVDEQLDAAGGGMRTYTDFARRSPIPLRNDGKTHTPRNSPPLVNASLDRDAGLLLHFDSEFSSLEDLVVATLTGRNYGYLPREKDQAIAHIARVIRDDDGSGNLAQDFGGLAYETVLTGTSNSIPREFRLPGKFRINVRHASDKQIVDAVAALISVYVKQLEFARDDRGNFVASPFDVFLEANGLPRQPAKKEAAKDYSRRLLRMIGDLESRGALTFIATNPATGTGSFDFHTEPFAFGPTELQGLRIFMGEPAGDVPTAGEIAAGGRGNCIACHAGPEFTDFGLHNTGVTQEEYDSVHGTGWFANLFIPNLQQRKANPSAFLPATSNHPDYQEVFRAIPQVQDPRLTDLGVWNVVLNPDLPVPQLKISRIICDDQVVEARGKPALQALLRRCLPDQLLDAAAARFKTPGLRDLSHSGPYFHTGQFATIEDVLAFYAKASGLKRLGMLRNGAEEIGRITIIPADFNSLAAFLRSLNEDYS